MKEKLQVKDLIRIGIFTAIYFVIFFTFGMLGYVPLLYIILPFYIPIVTGIPFMLFLSKTKKFGMVTIKAVLLGLLMFATGHTWVPIVTALVFGLLADFILKAGNYQNIKNTVIGYTVFSLWILGGMLPMWIMRDSYLEYVETSMGTEYINKIMALTTNGMLAVIIVLAVFGGLIGAFVGKKVLKKHFEKAGIA